MKVIYKYGLDLIETQDVYLPAGPILDIQEQNGRIQMWVEHEVGGTEFQTRTFKIRGTGCRFEPGRDGYIATVQLDGMVWHIYEELQ